MEYLGLYSISKIVKAEQALGGVLNDKRRVYIPIGTRMCMKGGEKTMEKFNMAEYERKLDRIVVDVVRGDCPAKRRLVENDY